MGKKVNSQKVSKSFGSCRIISSKLSKTMLFVFKPLALINSVIGPVLNSIATPFITTPFTSVNNAVGKPVLRP